jgi:CRISPR-associated protein Csd1
MILQALHQLAEDEQLVGDPDFEVRPIHWIIDIGPDGTSAPPRSTLTTPMDVADEAGSSGTRKRKAKKVKPVPGSYVVPLDPKFAMRTAASYPGVLFDKADYVFGVDVDPKDQSEKSRTRAAQRFELFRDRVHSIVAATGDDGVGAVVAFLDRVAAGNGPTPPSECGPGDLFAFKLFGDDDLVTSRPAVRAWWKSERASGSEGDPDNPSPPLQCLVTGKLFRGVDLFPKIKRVPGVQGDTSLVSFNNGAFLSYGLEGNENAPVSREAAEAIKTALDRLLHPAYPKPGSPGESLKPRSFRLSADTALCYWAHGGNEAREFADSFAALFSADADPEVVPALYRSIWRGQSPAAGADDLSSFYGLIITGTTGRAILRGWFETTLGQAKVAIANHFRDIAIVRNAPWRKDEEPPPAIPLGTMLEAIAEQGDRDNIPASLAGEFARAAITGTAYPFGLLTRAVERMRAEIGRTDWLDLQRRDARAALIKAVLNRRVRRDDFDPAHHDSPFLPQVTPDMDPNNKNTGYLLGRVLALLQQAQTRAIGKEVNATVVDKYYGVASATPGAIYPELLRRYRHHQAKMRSDDSKRGAGIVIDKSLQEVLGGIEEIPSTLALPDQCQFILGFHHQVAEQFKPSNKDNVANSETK